ncbi:MAG: hypothetical protein DWQ40_07610, partial [Actinobacteria bacterium]
RLDHALLCAYSVAIGADDLALGDFSKETLRPDGEDQFRDQLILVFEMIEIHRLRRKGQSTICAGRALEVADDCSVPLDSPRPPLCKSRQMMLLVPGL